MAVKISDLIEVEKRDPVLLASGDSSDVLHLIDREGKGQKPQYRSSSQKHYKITKCNRALEWTSAYTGGRAIDWQGRLCTRCGTPEQFQEVLNEYHQIHQEWREAYDAKQAAEQAESNRVWNLARDAASDFAYDLEAQKDRLGLTDIISDGYHITAVLTIDGRKHSVRIEVLAEGETP